MRYRLLLTKLARKQFRRLEAREKLRVQTAFGVIQENPNTGKKLEGEMKGYRSFRVWPYRVIYVVDHKVITVTVLRVGHRKDVYK